MNIPDFKEYLLSPNNTECIWINPNNLILEILWWSELAVKEYSKWEYCWGLDIEWSKAFVLRYRRERDNKAYPVSVLSYDEVDWWSIKIVQLQWARNKHVWFRVNSWFNIIFFFWDLINSIMWDKYMWDVKISETPNWLECSSDPYRTFWNYEKLARRINTKK